MRMRAPELYEEYIGQYLSQSEKNDVIQRDRDRAAEEGGPIQGRALSDFFMRALGMHDVICNALIGCSRLLGRTNVRAYLVMPNIGC